MSNDETDDSKEGLFHASQYLIISLISDLTNVREHIGDGDGALSMEAIKEIKKNIELLEKISEEFMDYEGVVIDTSEDAVEEMVSGEDLSEEIDVDEGLEIDEDKVVNFHRDFSQLKYVKVVSFSKEKNILDLSSKNNSETLNEEIKETSQQQEALRILLEQKK